MDELLQAMKSIVQAPEDDRSELKRIAAELELAQIPGEIGELRSVVLTGSFSSPRFRFSSPRIFRNQRTSETHSNEL